MGRHWLQAGLFSMLILSPCIWGQSGSREAPLPAIELYGAAWCGYCKRVRQYLQQKNLPFVEYDIDQDAEGIRYAQSSQFEGVPFLRIGEEEIQGDQPDEIEQALKKSGYLP